MAYATGSASGLADLLSKLKTFLSANGWTSLDEISATDHVYYSAGEDGETPIYVRVSDANAAGLLDGHLGYGISEHDWFATGKVATRGVLSLRAYQCWDSATHTGDVEQNGRLGRYLWWNRGNRYPYLGCLRGVSKTDPDGDGAIDVNYENGLFGVGYKSVTMGTAPANAVARFLNLRHAMFPSVKLFHDSTIAATSGRTHAFFHNLMNRENYIPTQTPTRTYGNYVLAMVGEEMYAYFFSTAAPYFSRTLISSAKIADASFETKATPSWGAPVIGTRLAVWDGDDTIYAARGGAGSYASFAKYSISADSWTNLANLPAGFSYAYAGSQFIYIPASDSGHAEDRIYMLGWSSTTTDSRIYYVNGASANTWSGSSVANLQQHNASVVAYLNGEAYGVAFRDGSDVYQGMDFAAHSYTGTLQTTPYTLTNVATYFVNRYVCDLHVSDSCTYYFICNKDHFKIAVKHSSNNRWYFTYGGKIDSYSKASKAIVNATSSTGANVAVSVDRDLGAEAGDVLVLLDPLSDYQLSASVISSTTSSVTLDTVSEAVPSGTLIGEDPIPVGIYSSQAMAFFPTNYASIDSLPAGVNAFYDVRPLGEPVIIPFKFSGPDWPVDASQSYAENVATNTINQRTQRYQLLPMVVQQTRPVMREMAEVRGQLIGVYATGATGEAVDGDTVTFGGQTYLMFQPSDYGQRDVPFLCIGPID
jgi:hypothetical protein